MSGGIAVLWKNSSKCSVLNFNRNFINILVQDGVKGDWRLTCYYGYPERARRRQAWALLRELHVMSTLPWCIIGDFNDLLSQNDKRGLHPHPDWLCSGFQEVISDCNLTDIPLVGYPFTWTKSRGAPHMIEERLDMALGSVSWLQFFPDAKLTNLVASHSDHSPILLSCEPVQQRRRRRKFRFENWWLDEEGLLDVVKESWLAETHNSVVEKISRCALYLEQWQKVQVQKNNEEKDILRAKLDMYRGSMDPINADQYMVAHLDYNKVLIREDTYWKQRAKTHWFRDGDRNTKFFHRTASVRRNSQQISMLLNDEHVEIRDQEGLCGVAKNYFEELFKEKAGTYEPVLALIHPLISSTDNESLTAPLSKDELYMALSQMHPNKSPGPDGFNPAFYQNFWDICGDDIFTEANLWLDRGFFPSDITHTNICLIPKNGNPSSMTDLRPISLCNVVYKILSKLLANRLKKCLDKCIREEQSAFVEGRSILDNAMIAFEVIHALKRRTSGNNAQLALKIDISKAYDRVDWGFLRGMLYRLGFAERANLTEVHNIMEILNLYADAAGQDINLSKSEVFFSRNISISAQKDLANIMGVHHVLGTGTYLGLPSLIGRSKKVIFGYVKDKIWKKINSWRGRPVSKAGKEVMIKSVLQSIPSYVMSLFVLPDGIIQDIEIMLNAFWWGGSSNQSCIKWMAWDKFTGPKNEGGLGFRDLKSFNLAMVAKRGWNLLSKPHSLVARIYTARYFPRSSFFEANLGNNPSFVWRSIWQARRVLSLGCRWSIGDGRHILVMGAPWLRGCSEGMLNGPQRQEWNVPLIRELFDYDVGNAILQVPLIDDVIEDKWNWKEEQNGCYSVRTGYRLWRKEVGSPFKRVVGDWSSLWNIKAPPRVKHLLWRICRDCLPTRVRLQNHHVPCTSICPFCELHMEDSWHVFFGCVVTNRCWQSAGLAHVVDPRKHHFHDATSLILIFAGRKILWWRGELRL
ncbi:uncharacterized protein LOC131650817 [Vicia villosa]|uniref:uncharacterized protein LOC131650817 n=1 Tax=Vicia villosa TaxID=3911 RepID=UPI00273B72D9|nr:uncharacterized protein LOC131650817 [Vicia villosa]